MNTDLMHDETCIEMARVLGERGEGFQELNLSSWDPKADAKHFETLAEVSGRPIMFEASRLRIVSRIAIGTPSSGWSVAVKRDCAFTDRASPPMPA